MKIQRLLGAKLFWLIFLTGTLCVFCAHPVPATDRGTVTVAVTIVPQKYFVNQIAKDRVKVIVMVPPGANPHTYEPKPKQMVALSLARAYFTIGIEFEKVWLGKIVNQNKHIKIFHMEQNIKKMAMPSPVQDLRKGSQSASTDNAKHDNMGKPDPHIWLSPPLVRIIASNTAEALLAIDPANKEFYRTNLERFLDTINRLDKKIRAILADKKNRAFIVFHPAWGYFAKAYGLKEIPIELQGKEPSPRELKEVIRYAKDRNINVILVEPQFSDRMARIISREIHGKLIKVDPLAYEWDKNLIRVAEIIAKVSK